MKNKKRILVAILAMAMMVSCFTGCGKTGSGEGTSNGKQTKIQIKYWSSGMGEDWLDAMVAAFEKAHPEYDVEVSSTADQKAAVAALGNADIDEMDLYFAVKQYEPDYLEPLDDVLDTTIKGESKSIREKFADYYLELEKAEDGKYYNLTYGGGMVGIIYNKKMFDDAGIVQTPRTTDELATTCDILYNNGEKAFCHFALAGYWEGYMADVFFAQYDGLDYVMNNFYGCVDEQGNSPSKDVFTKKDGRYEALKVFEQVVTPEYTMAGSNTYDHVTSQTMWLGGEAAMMVNGTWVEEEMKSIASTDDFAMMKTPVVSSITDKLTTVKADNELRKVVTAIDNVSDGKNKLEDYQQGDGYVVDGITVSASDWEYIRKARNTIASNYTGDSAFIPNYADNKEGAKEFLRFMYSDEGYKVYTDTLQKVLPLSLSEGEIDSSNWSAFSKNQAELYETTEQFVTDFIAGKHKIFYAGGATRWGSPYTYVNKFCSSNVSDRIGAAGAWKDILAKTEDNYENNWLENIK